MIFELINEEQANWSDESLLDALENLLKAFAEKQHIVIAPSSLLDKIIKNEDFSRKVRNIAAYAKQTVRELKALIKSDHVSTYIRIDLSNEDKFEIVEENQKTVLESGFAFFKNSSATQSTSILGEDLNDARFYIYIGNFYIKNNSILNKFTLKHSCCHGGGSQTAKIYNNILAENKFCYCIVDSDKKHPHSPRGETCKAFFKNINDFKEFFFEKFGQVRILDAHEVESIIPINVLDKIIEEGKSSDDQKLTIKRLKRMIEKNSNIRLFLDHKKGLKREDAYKLDDMYRKKKKFKGYYFTEFNKLIEQNNKCFEHIDQVDHECDDNCFIFAPMGSKLLSSTLKFFEDNNNYKKKDIDKITLPYWEIIGKDIFSWCCCYDVTMKAS